MEGPVSFRVFIASTMRQHPISPVTEPLQYRAIGVVRGVFVPADPEQLTRGVLRTDDGAEIEAVVLGRLLTLMRRHLDLAVPHLWVVYPRSREEQQLHLQLVGVWEPSTLATSDATAPEASSDADAQAESGAADPSVSAAPAPTPADALPEGDDYFSVRGELIYTRPETGDLVVKVRQLPRADGSRPIPFKLQLRGELPLEHLRHFVSLDLRRQGQQLNVEAFEVIGPLAQRGNRGGKARRGGADRAPAGRGDRGAAPAGGHGKAVNRPGR
jgi:hypothetical protein